MIQISSQSKVMIIGLDGATFDLIKPWAAEGELPTFKKLIDEGVHGPLTSTIPFATIPAWPAFATGCNPGKHGFYDFFIERENSYELTVEMQPSRVIKQPTLWSILSKHHKSVAVINVPATYPPSKVNGYMITGMLTPPGAKCSYPPEFHAELEQNIGKYNTFFSALSAKNPDMLGKDLENTLEQRIRAVEYLWKEKQTDFLMMVDNGTDRAEHELWRFLDPLNPLHNADEVIKFGNPLLKYYQTVDKAMARILELMDENTTLIIMSDHGQGTLRKWLNINLFLIQSGYMVVKNNVFSRLKYLLFRCGYCPRNLYRLLQKFGFERYASDRVSQKTRLSLLNKLFFSTTDIDWKRTRAFAAGMSGGIRINLTDRQPSGMVQPGEEYEHLRKEISEKLVQWEDPFTGDAVIKTAYKREELYHGDCLEKAPDIVAVQQDTYEFFNMHGFSSNQDILETFGNSGCHRPNGIFIAYGNEMKKGVELEGATIIDVAPTVLHIMNIPIPKNMDGQVLNKVFNKESDLASKSVKYDTSNLESDRIKHRLGKIGKK